MTKRAAIYCRISKDPKGDMLGVQRQEQACRELCQSNGWEVVEPPFVDDDRSAYSGKPRPGYVALLEAVKARSVDVVVAWAPDRLTRSARDLEELIDTVEAAEVDIATVQSGVYDLSTPSGRMSARVVGAVARYESEHKSARLRAKATELATAGKVGGGGTRPFGYNEDRRTIDKAEAKLVRDAADRIIAGETLRGIAVDWNTRNICTTAGKAWATHSLRRMLASPRIAGLRQHRGQTIGKAEWGAIIDETTHHQLRAILLDPARRAGGTARSYLLTGFTRCALCDAKLVARPRSDKRRCYVCATGPGFHGCGKIRVLAEQVEEYVVAMLLEAVDSGAWADAMTPAAPEDDTTAAEVVRVEGEIDALADDYADGTISRDAYKRAAARLEARLVDERRTLATTSQGAAQGRLLADPVPLASRWVEMSFDQRRTALAAAVEAVVVAPAVKGRNRFDPDRVSIRWKG